MPVYNFSVKRRRPPLPLEGWPGQQHKQQMNGLIFLGATRARCAAVPQWNLASGRTHKNWSIRLLADAANGKASGVVFLHYGKAALAAMAFPDFTIPVPVPRQSPQSCRHSP